MELISIAILVIAVMAPFVFAVTLTLIAYKGYPDSRQ